MFVVNNVLRGEHLKQIREREYMKNMNKYEKCYLLK